MTKTEKRLRQEIKILEADLNAITADLQEAESDREEFRSFIVKNLKWFVQLQGEGKNPLSAYLIEDTARFMTRVKRWTW